MRCLVTAIRWIVILWLVGIVIKVGILGVAYAYALMTRMGVW